MVLVDSSQLRCRQLLTPDTARRCESIVPPPRARESAPRARGGLQAPAGTRRDIAEQYFKAFSPYELNPRGGDGGRQGEGARKEEGAMFDNLYDFEFKSMAEIIKGENTKTRKDT